jgi:hypothetical protein
MENIPPPSPFAICLMQNGDKIISKEYLHEHVLSRLRERIAKQTCLTYKDLMSFPFCYKVNPV